MDLVDYIYARDIDGFTAALETHDYDYETEHDIVMAILFAAGRVQKVEFLYPVVENFSLAAAWLTHALSGVDAALAADEPLDADFIATILWSYYDHVVINKWQDIFPDTAEFDAFTSAQLKQFIMDFRFDATSQPRRKIKYSGAEYDIDTIGAIMYCCMHQLVGELSLIVGDFSKVSPDDLHSILWWTGFHANDSMLDLIILRCRATPMWPTICAKIWHALPRGMARGTYSETMLAQMMELYKEHLAEHHGDGGVELAISRDIFPHDLFVELAQQPNKKVARFFDTYDAKMGRSREGR